MNVNQLISMVIRIVMRRGVHMAVNKGIDLSARRGERSEKQVRQTKNTAHKARRSFRLLRRFTR